MCRSPRPYRCTVNGPYPVRKGTCLAKFRGRKFFTSSYLNTKRTSDSSGNGVHSPPQKCQNSSLQRVPAKPNLIQELLGGNYIHSNRCCPMRLGQVNSRLISRAPEVRNDATGRTQHKHTDQRHQETPSRGTPSSPHATLPNSLLNPAFSVNINMFPIV